MRLDLFLKLSRLCPRRSIAQQLCDAGFVLLNGRPAKSAHAVKTGDEIIIRRRDHQTTARVLSIPSTHNLARRDAKLLAEIVNEKELESDIWGLSDGESNADNENKDAPDSFSSGRANGVHK
jgi:ribosomal 50S subunit-recycling heat shock protein